MDQTKYVIAKAGMFGNMESVFIISNNTSHDEIPFREENIVSAGFFTWEVGEDACGNKTLEVHTFGESVSLGVKSRIGDAGFIEEAMNWWI